MNIYCSTTQSLLVEPEDAVNKELIVKLYMSFQLYRKSVPLTPMLFKSQLNVPFPDKETEIQRVALCLRPTAGKRSKPRLSGFRSLDFYPAP